MRPFPTLKPLIHARYCTKRTDFVLNDESGKAFRPSSLGGSYDDGDGDDDGARDASYRAASRCRGDGGDMIGAAGMPRSPFCAAVDSVKRPRATAAEAAAATRASSLSGSDDCCCVGLLRPSSAAAGLSRGASSSAASTLSAGSFAPAGPLGAAAQPASSSSAASPAEDDLWQVSKVSYTAVTADGVRLHLTRARCGAAAALRPRAHPVMLVPGLASSWEATWDVFPELSFVDHLARQGYDCWGVDLRGESVE